MKNIRKHIPGLRSDRLGVVVLSAVFYLWCISGFLLRPSIGTFLGSLAFILVPFIYGSYLEQKNLKDLQNEDATQEASYFKARNRMRLLIGVFILAFILAATTGCTDSNVDTVSEEETTTTEVIETPSEAEEATPKEETAVEKAPANLAGFETATINRHVDGDTVVVNLSGTEERLRFIGVDTPETKHPRKGVEFFGPEASAYTAERLPVGAEIYLQKDVSDRDRYGRLLRYVWLSLPASSEPTTAEVKAHMFNAHLVANGYAQPVTYPPDVKYADLFQELAQKARSAGWGLWQNGENLAETTPTNEQTSSEGSAAQAQGRIKGNRNSRIYHMPGGRHYNSMSEHNVVYFDTEEEAQQAGYRRAKV